MKTISDHCVSSDSSEATQLQDQLERSPSAREESTAGRRREREEELEAMRQECQRMGEELGLAQTQLAERGLSVERRSRDRAELVELKAELARSRGEAGSPSAAGAGPGGLFGSSLRSGPSTPRSGRLVETLRSTCEDEAEVEDLRDELAAERAARAWQDRQHGHECMMVVELQQLLLDAQARADRHALKNRALLADVAKLEQQSFEDSASRAANLGHNSATRVRIAELERLLAESQKAVASFARQQGMLRSQLLARDAGEWHSEWQRQQRHQRHVLENPLAPGDPASARAEGLRLEILGLEAQLAEALAVQQGLAVDGSSATAAAAAAAATPREPLAADGLANVSRGAAAATPREPLAGR